MLNLQNYRKVVSATVGVTAIAGAMLIGEAIETNTFIYIFAAMFALILSATAATFE